MASLGYNESDLCWAHLFLIALDTSFWHAMPHVRHYKYYVTLEIILMTEEIKLPLTFLGLHKKPYVAVIHKERTLIWVGATTSVLAAAPCHHTKLTPWWLETPGQTRTLVSAMTSDVLVLQHLAIRNHKTDPIAIVGDCGNEFKSWLC